MALIDSFAPAQLPPNWGLPSAVYPRRSHAYVFPEAVAPFQGYDSVVVCRASPQRLGSRPSTLGSPFSPFDGTYRPASCATLWVPLTRNLPRRFCTRLPPQGSPVGFIRRLQMTTTRPSQGLVSPPWLPLAFSLFPRAWFPPSHFLPLHFLLIPPFAFRL